MQNKTKLFLILMGVSMVSFFLTGKVQAATCSCGTAINTSHSTAPTSNLCAGGSPSSVTSRDGYWNWTCGDGSCDEATCSARNTATITVGCCCEDTVAKQCTNVACPANCGASSNSYNTVCSSIPDSATKCKGTASTDSCSSGVCLLGSACMTLGKGTCANPKNVCCLDGGGTTETPKTPTGPIVPSQLAGLPTNPNLVKGIFTNVANFLLSIIGIIAIISFVISGIQYFMVATDEKMMESAKKTMVYSIVGLVVALFGYIAIKTVEMLLKG